MCDKCQEQELIHEEIMENDGLPTEEMFGVPVLMMEDLDENEFDRGIKDASYIAGFYATCKNAGMYAADIVSILLNRETIEYNLKAAKLNSDMNLEISKNQAVNVDKTSL